MIHYMTNMACYLADAWHRSDGPQAEVQQFRALTDSSWPFVGVHGQQ